MSAATTREVRQAIMASLAEPPFTHIELVRSQVPLSSGSASGFCVELADELKIPRELALPCAEALAFLETMTFILHDIGAPNSASDGSLIHEWQMPRALNAADACYVLAHQRVSSLSAQLSPDVLLVVTDIFDETCQAVAEVLADAISNEGVDWQRQVNFVLANGAMGLTAALRDGEIAVARDLQRRLEASLAAIESLATATGVRTERAAQLIADFLTNVGGES